MWPLTTDSPEGELDAHGMGGKPSVSESKSICKHFKKDDLLRSKAFHSLKFETKAILHWKLLRVLPMSTLEKAGGLQN